MKCRFAHETASAGTARVAVLVFMHSNPSIVETLASVAAQTLQSLELVVCCDGDDNAELACNWLKSHVERFVRLVLLDTGTTEQAAARDAAVASAQAPYVFLLDAGNSLQPACLERSVEILAELDEKGAFVFSQQVVCGRSLQNLADWNPDDALGNRFDVMALHKKAALEVVGGYASNCEQAEALSLWGKYAGAGFYGIKVHQPLSTAPFRRGQSH